MRNLLVEILDYCNENSGITYGDLVDYSAKNKQEWLEIISQNTSLIKEYLNRKDDCLDDILLEEK